ncbi:hypothetical protein AC249_AIPGENE24477, partial [Exaiptasia diaphana]
MSRPYKKLFEFQDPRQAAAADTGFSENTYTSNIGSSENEQTLEQSQMRSTEKRPRVMTEKGLGYRLAVKEKLGLAASKAFDGHVKTFLALIANSCDPSIIDDEIDKLVARAESTHKTIDEWLELVTQSEKSPDLVTALKTEIKASLEQARSAAVEKIQWLKREETSSIFSATSKSRKSSRSQRSSHSSKETLITVKAKRAALEQTLKYNDQIQMQQSALNKLKLEQELSEVKATETVYEQAIKEFEEFKIDDFISEPGYTINRYLSDDISESKQPDARFPTLPTFSAANDSVTPAAGTLRDVNDTRFPTFTANRANLASTGTTQLLSSSMTGNPTERPIVYAT